MSTAMTVRAPARARSARSRSGKSASGSAPSSTSTSMRPSAAACRMPVGVEAGRRRARAGQASANQSRPSSRRDPTGQQARGEAHVEGAVHVAAAQGREEAGVGAGGDQRRRRRRRRRRRDSASEARPSDDGERARRRRRAGPAAWARSAAVDAADVRSPSAAADEGAATSSPTSPGRGCRRAVASAAQAGGRGADLDEGDAVVRRRRGGAAGTGPAAPPWGRGRAGARCRRGAQTSSMVARGRPSTTLGGQAVAELGVDVVGADARPWPAWPRRRRPRW